VSISSFGYCIVHCSVFSYFTAVHEMHFDEAVKTRCHCCSTYVCCSVLTLAITFQNLINSCLVCSLSVTKFHIIHPLLFELCYSQLDKWHSKHFGCHNVNVMNSIVGYVQEHVSMSVLLDIRHYYNPEFPAIVTHRLGLMAPCKLYCCCCYSCLLQCAKSIQLCYIVLQFLATS